MTGQEQKCVRDVMAEPTQYIQASQALLMARQRMQGMMGVKSLIVVDEGMRPTGMVRYNDIDRESTAGATVADVMLSDIPTIGADQALEDLSGVMTQYDVDRLPVVDAGGTLVGELPRAALTLSVSTATEATTTGQTLSDAAADRQTPTYDIKQGMAVVGTGGGKIGAVKEVRADTLSGALTHIIVHTGLVFGKDTAIPADLIDSVEGDEICLKVDKTQIDALPNLKDAE